MQRCSFPSKSDLLCCCVLFSTLQPDVCQIYGFIQIRSVGSLGDRLHRIRLLGCDLIDANLICNLQPVHFLLMHDQLDYAKWWMEDEREELLLEYCGTFGVSEEEVELLLEVGYDPDEIEELLMDTAAMEEAISEAKALLQCEA